MKPYWIAALFMLLTPPVSAAGLVTSLSSHLVSISSSFTGSEILVFGAVGEVNEDPSLSPFETHDIAIIVRGPGNRVIARNKQRALGVWVNRAAIEFDDVPGFYAAATTEPLREIASETVLRRHQIGSEFLRFSTRAANDPAEVAQYREAVVRNRMSGTLYHDEIGNVTFLGERLFRWTLKLPATVPDGNYKVEVYLLRGGQVVSAQASPLFVHKIGLERSIFRFSRDHALLYGMAAVLLALGAGWLANFAFQDD